MMTAMQYYRTLQGETEPVFTPFISTWNTANTSVGSSTSTQVKLPLVSAGTYNFVVTWGDATSDVITTWNQVETTHTYASSGTYTITITGLCLGFSFAGLNDRLKIIEISQWGDSIYYSDTFNNQNNGHYRGCSNLTILSLDSPKWSTNRSCEGFFFQATNITGSGISNINLSGQISLIGFFNTTNFNESINSWDVSSVVLFNSMFSSCPNFNQDLNSWDVSSATSLLNMFNTATNFNGNISSWDVSNVVSFQNTFNSAGSFNSNIGMWNTVSATNFSQMFFNAFAFNINIGDWNVSTVTNFANFMFGKTALNFSTSNLDAIYNGWSLRSVVTGISITFGTAKYTAGSSSGRAILTSAPNNWVITDGGI